MSVMTLRHEQIFSSVLFNPRCVDVVGCGALGSRIAMSLAKLGIMNINLWDFDKIEEHNIANQLFGNGDVGEAKTDALTKMILEATGTDCYKNGRCEGDKPFGDVVFMCVDSMKVRKELWEKQVKYQPSVGLLVESRMGADSCRVYAIQPCNPQHVELYEQTLYGDEEAATSVCGSSISVGPTAEIVSGIAVWQFIKWWRWSQRSSDQDTEPESEVILALRQQFMVISRKFE